MPHYKGGTLTNWVHVANPGDDQKQRVLNQMLQGIKYMHANGVVHLDLKPANVFMSCRDADAVPRVGDFDVSKSVDERAECMMTCNSLAGGMSFQAVRDSIPPELRKKGTKVNQNAISPKADMYSFGVMMLEVLFPTTFSSWNGEGKPNWGTRLV
jgi:serine/threonine protein kinase